MSYRMEIQSGAFRFYPNDDDAKKRIWALKVRFGIPTECTKWEEVWSLYIHPWEDGIAKVTIQK